MGPVGPQRLADHVGEADVGDSQPPFVAEDQSRWTNVAVDETVAMDDIESLARLETDHQGLRRRQRATAVEVLAQTPATEVLDDDVHRLAVVPDVGAPVVDLGDVGVLDGGALLGGHPERAFEAFTRAEIGVDDLDGNDSLFDQVKGIEDSGIDTTAAPRSELVATRDDPTVELCIHQCHGVQNATATLARSAVMPEIGPATEESRRNHGRMSVMNRRHFDTRQRRLLVCSLVIAVGFVMVILGFQASVTGKKALALPPTIEDIDPVRGAVRVPSQTAVFVDLLSGYTGVLVIDGIELKTVDPNDPNDPNAPAPGGARSAGDAAADNDLRARQRNLDVRADRGSAHRVVRTGNAHGHGDLLEGPRVASAFAFVHLDVLGLLADPTCDVSGHPRSPISGSVLRSRKSSLGCDFGHPLRNPAPKHACWARFRPSPGVISRPWDHETGAPRAARTRERRHRDLRRPTRHTASRGPGALLVLSFCDMVTDVLYLIEY